MEISSNINLMSRLGERFGQQVAQVRERHLQKCRWMGNFVLYSQGQQALWASNSQGFGAHLELQDDGNIVVYQQNGPLWSRLTGLLTPPRTTVPSAPRSVFATSGEFEQSTISWTPPADTGNLTPVTYSVSSTPSVAIPAACQQSLLLSCTVTGLANDTAYTFRVTASNLVGLGGGDVATATPGQFFSIKGVAPNATTASGTTAPGLFPAFSGAITDYVSRCSAAQQTPVTVNASSGTTITVAGQAIVGPQFGTTVNISRDFSQSFTVTVANGAGTTDYHVRCLPESFPTWSVSRPASPQAAFYITTTLANPLLGASSAQFNPSQPTIFDNHGVPVWWTALDSFGGAYATLLPNGNVAYGNGLGTGATGSFKELQLDGTSVAMPAPSSDPHDITLLKNGDYLTAKDTLQTGVDLSQLSTPPGSGPVNAPVFDQVIEEWAPGSNSLVRSWDLGAIISPTEMDPQWFASMIAAFPTAPAAGYDVYHFNSLDPVYGNDGVTLTGFVVSLRHLDAIYKIGIDGTVQWKLGGTPLPGKSLSISGDSVFSNGSGFGGQHDARFGAMYGTDTLPSLTLYDDGTGRGRSPRSVRYLIDESAHTAQLVESVSNATAPATALCCGSTRKLTGGNWVTAWGGFNPTFTEMTPSGSTAFSLTYTGVTGLLNDYFLYRAEPLSTSQVTIAQLRAGMDSQYPPP